MRSLQIGCVMSSDRVTLRRGSATRNHIVIEGSSDGIVTHVMLNVAKARRMSEWLTEACDRIEGVNPPPAAPEVI